MVMGAVPHTSAVAIDATVAKPDACGARFVAGTAVEADRTHIARGARPAELANAVGRRHSAWLRGCAGTCTRTAGPVAKTGLERSN